MELITSVKNRYVKEARSLRDKKYRDETGLFFVEGINILRDMPDEVDVEYLFVTEKRRAEAENLLAYTRARVYYVSEAVMDCLADTVTPYGIAAVLRIPVRAFSLPRGNALLLDGLTDPGNIGTIIRTAAAAGFDDVYMLGCADVYAPKTVRATLGGLFKVRIYVIGGDEAMTLLHNTNSFALDADGDDLMKGGLPSPVLFAVGSEAHGVSSAVLGAAKGVKSLPMKGGIESLNAAVACSVAMYQTFRRLYERTQ